jgi:hypothetical protein
MKTLLSTATIIFFITTGLSFSHTVKSCDQNQVVVFWNGSCQTDNVNRTKSSKLMIMTVMIMTVMIMTVMIMTVMIMTMDIMAEKIMEKVITLLEMVRVTKTINLTL